MKITGCMCLCLPPLALVCFRCDNSKGISPGLTCMYSLKVTFKCLCPLSSDQSRDLYHFQRQLLHGHVLNIWASFKVIEHNLWVPSFCISWKSWFPIKDPWHESWYQRVFHCFVTITAMVINEERALLVFPKALYPSSCDWTARKSSSWSSDGAVMLIPFFFLSTLAKLIHWFHTAFECFPSLNQWWCSRLRQLYSRTCI